MTTSGTKTAARQREHRDKYRALGIATISVRVPMHAIGDVRQHIDGVLLDHLDNLCEVSRVSGDFVTLHRVSSLPRPPIPDSFTFEDFVGRLAQYMKDGAMYPQAKRAWTAWRDAIEAYRKDLHDAIAAERAGHADAMYYRAKAAVSGYAVILAKRSLDNNNN